MHCLAKGHEQERKTQRSNKGQNRKKNIKLHQNVAEASWFPSNSWQVSKDDVLDAPPMYKMVMACSFQVRNKNKEESSFQFKVTWPAADSLFLPYPHEYFEKVAGTFFLLCRAVFPSISWFHEKKRSEKFQALSIAVMPDPVEKISKIRQDDITKSGTTGAMRAKPKRTAGPSCMWWRYKN